MSRLPGSISAARFSSASASALWPVAMFACASARRSDAEPVVGRAVLCTGAPDGAGAEPVCVSATARAAVDALISITSAKNANIGRGFICGHSLSQTLWKRVYPRGRLGCNGLRRTLNGSPGRAGQVAEWTSLATTGLGKVPSHALCACGRPGTRFDQSRGLYESELNRRRSEEH